MQDISFDQAMPDVKPDIAMERIINAYQTGDIGDEEFVEEVYQDEVLDGVMEDDDDDDSDEGYDDNALSDLISKLRESAKKDTEKGGNDLDETETTLRESDEELDDDAIAKHLKMLTKGFKNKASVNHVVSESESDSDEDMATSSEEESSDDDEEEEEEEEEADYSQVDEFMKKLGIDSSIKPKNEGSLVGDRKKWLESLTSQGTTSDYQANPMTVAAKKKWLADLATDVLQHASDDDESMSEEEEIKKEIEVYDVNVKELQEAAEKAKMIIENMDEEVVKATPPPRPNQRFNQRKNEWNKPDAEPRKKEIEKVELKPVPKPVPKQVEKKVEPEVPSEKVELKAAKPIEKTVEVEKLKVPEVDLKETKKEEKVEVEKPDFSVKPSTFKQMKEELKEDVKIVIPPGYPPYPGYGPKWPWHPTSPQAPPGYKDCYMHYMGKAYYEYMSYLEDYSRKVHEDAKKAEASAPAAVQAEAPKKEEPKPVEKKERVAVVKTGDQHEKYSKGRGKVVTMSERKVKELAKSKSGSSKTTGKASSTKAPKDTPKAPAADQGCACVIL